MAQNMRNFIQPDFQASSQPMMDWMPWEQNQDAANAAGIAGAMKQYRTDQKAKQGAPIEGGFTLPTQSPQVGMGHEAGNMLTSPMAGSAGKTAGKGASSL